MKENPDLMRLRSVWTWGKLGGEGSLLAEEASISKEGNEKGKDFFFSFRFLCHFFSLFCNAARQAKKSHLGIITIY